MNYELRKYDKRECLVSTNTFSSKDNPALFYLALQDLNRFYGEDLQLIPVEADVDDREIRIEDFPQLYENLIKRILRPKYTLYWEPIYVTTNFTTRIGVDSIRTELPDIDDNLELVEKLKQLHDTSLTYSHSNSLLTIYSSHYGFSNNNPTIYPIYYDRF